MNEEMVLITDDDAAKRHTLNGWLSRTGRFYDNEEMARWDGCTHKLCDCGNTMSKSYTACDSCREKNAIERYNKLTRHEWNGFDLLYSDSCDVYFQDMDEVNDYCEEHELKISDLRLKLCQPCYARKIEEDYFCDDLAEDQDAPPEIQEAMRAFNKALDDYGRPLSWWPSDKAADIKE